MRNPLEATIRGLPFCVALIDVEGRVLFANDGLLQAGGRSVSPPGRREPETPQLADLIPAEILSATSLLVQAKTCAATGREIGPCRVLYRAPGVNRILRYRLASAARAGRRDAVFATFEDVTDFERLIRFSADLQKVVDEIPLSLAVVDGAGAIKLINRRFAALAGPTDDSHEKKNLSTLPFCGRLLLDRASSIPALLRGVRQEGGRALRQAVPWPGANGASRCVDILWVALEGAGGEEESAASYLLMITDVTEREKARAFEERLGQSAKLAAIGEMMATLAHEINNPLSVVSGNAQFLCSTFGQRPLDGVSSADWKEIAAGLQSILDQSDRCCKFVSDLLQLCYPRRSLQAATAVSVNQVVEDLLRIYEPTLAKESIRLLLRLEPGDVRALADPNELYQVFLNFLCNARAAMTGGGELRIQTSREETWAKVVVSDTGTGMSRDHMKRLFTPFFTTKPPGKGTGLGLSIARAIVERYGGRIEAESELGKGATFIVRLPLSGPPCPEQAEPCVRGREE